MTQTLERTKIVDFAQELLTDELVDQMIPLWMDHYEEITYYKDIKLSPAIEIYQAAQKQGSLKIYTARHKEKLVGYEVFFIYKHPHYSDVKEAVQDVLFLDQNMRHGSIGYRFMKWADEQLEHEGAAVIFRCVSNKHDYSSLLKRMGFVAHDTVYSRRTSCLPQSQ